MPKKETPEMLLTKHMGKDAANALLGKIDKMIAKGESVAKIEKAASDEIAKHIELQITNAVKIAVGPEPIVVKPTMIKIGVAVKQQTAINQVFIPIKVKLPTKVQVGPQIKVK